MSWGEFLTLAPGSDRITVELFQILKDDAVESAALNMQYAQNMQYAGSRQEVILTLRAGERMGFPSGSDGKESACNAGDHGLIPGSGSSPGEGRGSHSRILAWRIPWTEEPGGLQSMGSQRVGHG